MISLLKHRENLKNNPMAYSSDLPRCYKTVVKHLKDAGYKKITYLKASEDVEMYVDYIFLSQQSRPFFHISSKSELPFCWNSPSKGGWDVDYIKYEWGHLNSINQCGEIAYSIENLCLQSARCNQHIQSSMNVSELLEYGGKLADAIKNNTSARKNLFISKKWRDLKSRLEQWI